MYDAKDSCMSTASHPTCSSVRAAIRNCRMSQVEKYMSTIYDRLSRHFFKLYDDVQRTKGKIVQPL
jgi:hypothetical protein